MFAAIGEVQIGPKALAALRAQLHDEQTFRLEQLEGISEVWPLSVGRRDDQQTLAREEVLNALAAAARVVLADVEAALSRMDAGRYGSCHLCDWPIPVQRLKIVPHARYCEPCHQLTEAAA
ncbi:MULTISPECIES: TraR/DksA C4-type zinc finger protein [Kribbella]|uniref:TraR/DksA C4-type zinc finger protein n=1 Tax=Kribbella TaxID=182639 RepID=UPI001F5402A9|nr:MULTISPECIES: TraR/DksA C4-type zinc finger protein [Kribbella]